MTPEERLAEVERSYKTELRLAFGAMVDLRRKLAEQQSATRRSNATVHVALAAMRALLDSVRDITLIFPTDERATAHGKVWREAEEVLRLNGIPF